MVRRPECDPLYKAYEIFQNNCLLGDNSLLWPQEEAWTLENVSELRRRMIDEPIIGADLSFQEKLLEQMKGLSHQQWMIICDIFFVYFLPSNHFTFETKKNNLKWAAEKGGLILPKQDDEIWKAQTAGFTRTGIKFHHKYAQFWLLLLFAQNVKQLEDPERMLNDHKLLEQTLDSLLEGIPDRSDRAYDMRHAILYMSFPDIYERMISSGDKQSIVKTYGDRIDGPVPENVDEAIRQIRETLSDQYDKLDRPFDFYDELKAEWRETGSTLKSEGQVVDKPSLDQEEKGEVTQAIPEDKDIVTVLSTLSRTRNVIIYGPPGTGKTYVAKQAAERIVRPQTTKQLSEPILIQRIIEDLTMYDVLALSMYITDPAGKHLVPDIQNQEMVRVRFRLSPIKNERENIWGRLQEHTHPDSKTVNVTIRRAPYLFDKDDHSRWFLTDPGQEYVRTDLSAQLSSLQTGTFEESDPSDFIMWSTFHQSYSYEEFVEGLWPEESSEEPGSVTYRVKPGIFRKICKRAVEDPDNNYVLVIDEINRGNISKILGELITLLEDDKRSGEENELSVLLPYSEESFSVPKNLFVIGTMNTADRSIALLDVALRRRFAFIEVMPRPDLLDSVVIESQEATLPLDNLLRELNSQIIRHIDRDHQIGHSYFLKVANVDQDEQVDMLDFVWNNQIFPLLEEYFYSQRQNLAEVLAPFITEQDFPVTYGVEEQLEIQRQHGDDLIFALAKLANKD